MGIREISEDEKKVVEVESQSRLLAHLICKEFATSH